MPAQECNDDQFIQHLAKSLRHRGWQTPAVMLLELFRPFSLIFSQALLLAEPFLSFLVGDHSRHYVALLEDETNLERLLETLEAKENS